MRSVAKMHSSLCLLVGFLCLVFLLTPAFTDENDWQGLNRRGVEAYKQGRYPDAEELLSAALTEAEKLGKEDSRLAASLNNLAAVYRAQHKYGEAEPLYKRALTILKEALGHEHPDVAANLNNLGRLYYEIAKQADARLAENLLSSPQILDPATSYQLQVQISFREHKYAEAEPLFKQALRIQEKTLRQDHPDLAMTLIHLADLYFAQGMYKKAGPLYSRTLAIQEETFGAEHINVSDTVYRMALMYKLQKKYLKSEPFFLRALSIREGILGPEHNEVGEILANYASLLRRMGRKDEAKKMEARAKAIHKKHAQENPQK